MAIQGANIRQFRKLKKMSQARLAERAGVSQQLISQLERGEAVSSTELPSLAWALEVPLHALDPEYAPDESGVPVAAVPLLAWVSAGRMLEGDPVENALGSIRVADLPANGDWIALRVVGDSMDKISPPDSIIFLDRKDKTLVPNGLYVISDEEGRATYKRYRPSPMRFEPVSTNDSHEPIFPDQEPKIVGRVRRSMIDM